MELGSLQLDANTYYYKNGTMILNVSDNTIPEIILKYKGLGEVLNISDVRIYKYESEVERVCLNYDTDSEYQVTLMDQTWHQINDNNFNGFIVNGVQYGKMYKEDLLENIENQSIENSNHYTWYNKKRRLVISDSVSLVLGDSQVDLSSIKVAVVNELSDRTVGGYSVYNVDGCFRKDYVITLIDDEEFILSREYDENFLLTRSLNHKGIEKTNTYNSDGNILSTALKHKNGSCAIKTEFIYDGKYLLNDITYLNGNEVINSYDYNRNTGDLIMKTNYLGVDTYYDYDQFNRFNKL